MNLKPACYQDLLEGKTLYQRMRKDRGVYEFVEIVPGGGRQCPTTIVGPSYLMGWRWKDRDIGGSQGHLPIQRYETESAFRRERQEDPVLYVEVIEQGAKPADNQSST